MQREHTATLPCLFGGRRIYPRTKGVSFDNLPLALYTYRYFYQNIEGRSAKPRENKGPDHLSRRLHKHLQELRGQENDQCPEVHRTAAELFRNGSV